MKNDPYYEYIYVGDDGQFHVKWVSPNERIEQLSKWSDEATNARLKLQEKMEKYFASKADSR